MFFFFCFSLRTNYFLCHINTVKIKCYSGSILFLKDTWINNERIGKKKMITNHIYNVREFTNCTYTLNTPKKLWVTSRIWAICMILYILTFYRRTHTTQQKWAIEKQRNNNVSSNDVIGNQSIIHVWRHTRTYLLYTFSIHHIYYIITHKEKSWLAMYSTHTHIRQPHAYIKCH